MQPDRPFRFACTHCGECCRWPGDVRLTDADVQRMAAHVGTDEPDFIERFTRLAANRQGLSLVAQEGGACVFLEDDRCAIYDARPQQCRDFPLTWSVPGGCPGITYLDV